MGHVAGECCKLCGREVLHRRAVTPVDAVAQYIGRHVGADDVQRVQRRFVAAGVAREHQPRYHVANRDALDAQREGAVFVGGGDDDVAASARTHAIGVDVGEQAARSSPFAWRVVVVGRAVAPVDAVAHAGIDAGVGDRTHAEGVGGTFGHGVCTRDGGGGCHVGHEHGVDTGVGPDPVFIGHAHGDLACEVAVVVGVAELPVGGEVGSQHGLRAAVAPVDEVLRNGVGAGVVSEQRHRVVAALGHRACAADGDLWRHIGDVDKEAVAADLGDCAAVVHRDIHGVRPAVVGVGLADVEAELARVDEPVAGGAITPVNRVAAAGAALVGGVGEADGAAEEGAFVDGGVGARVNGDDFSRCADGHRLAAGRVVAAILVGQPDRDDLVARGEVSVGDDAVGRQGGCRVGFDGRAVAPVDAVLADGVGARVAGVAEVECVDLTLFDRVVAEERDGRRHIGNHRREGAAFDAVALTLLVVDGDGDVVAAVVCVGAAYLRRGTAGDELRVGAAVAPDDSDEVALGVRVADGKRGEEAAAFAAIAVRDGSQARAVVHVGQEDVREHRLRGEGNAVAACPTKLVGTEEIDIAGVGEQARLEVGNADLLADGHRCAVEEQRAIGRRRDDLDGLQALPVGVYKAAFEHRVGERDDLFFQAVDNHVADVRRGVAEALQADLVGVVAAVAHAVAVLIARVLVAGVGDDKAAVGHAGHGRLVLCRWAVGVDQRLAVDRAAVGVVLLREHVVAGDVGVGPRDNKAASFQARDLGLVLLAVDVGVDAEFAAHLGAERVEALGVDAGGREVLAGRLPHRDEAAGLQCRHRRHVLRAVDVAVDLERVTLRHATRIEALAEDAGPAAVARVVAVQHHEVPASERGDGRLVLRCELAGAGRVGARLHALGHAGRVIALEQHVGVLGDAGVGVLVVVPGHDVAGGCGGDGGLVLITRRDGVDARLHPCRAAVGSVALHVDASATAVARVAAPHHHPAAVAQRRHLGLVLVAGRGGVDHDLRADLGVVGIKALLVDAVAATV